MQEVTGIVQAQKQFFYTGKTRELAFRMSSLEKLRDAVKRYEPDIMTALKKDLNKSEAESYITEIGFVLQEIKYVMKHLNEWVKPKKVKSPLTHFGSRSMIYPDPYGVTLIISPWNYPFQLSVAPLIGAIAAGNCAVIKPSEYAPHVSKLLVQMLEGIFEQEYVTVVEGAAEVSEALLKEPFDYIFFTGSVPVGKKIMEAASKTLTPVTLELGGKSPAIVDKDANLDLAAKRLVWGKCINAGQTCVAPDYLLVHEEVKNGLLEKMKEAIREFYGEDPLQNPGYAKIISDRHFSRLAEFLKDGKIIIGGETDPEKRLIAPTLLDEVDWNSRVMAEEIFGPILPVLTFSELSDVITKVREMPKPLALYFFSENEKKQEEIIASIPFGGGCINDTLIHLATPYLPFGGVGTSGIGSYHGQYSFECFSHQKSIVKQTTRFDLPVRYPSFKNGLKMIKKLMN
ncbi:aldehyde dehydrogenase [Lihuaxuella thermophila]|uniref:Aldehyde dehydrogenase n=1 Tax=Lihuaxuella thermophila TaxID=1173111 RepID=A0A1H8APL0_9BACL|nr:aldehyde dehydrogenase [Lihuaxuella thermophila]SEM72503.1 aldehyde dehydrogenase (NAD+) [Lihuaxuella thermophila]